MQLRNEESTRSPVLTVVFVALATLVLDALIWVYERDLLWMLAVLLPPLWMPVILQFSEEDRAPERSRLATWGVAAGLGARSFLAVIIYFI